SLLQDPHRALRDVYGRVQSQLLGQVERVVAILQRPWLVVQALDDAAADNQVVAVDVQARGDVRRGRDDGHLELFGGLHAQALGEFTEPVFPFRGSDAVDDIGDDQVHFGAVAYDRTTVPIDVVGVEVAALTQVGLR